MCYDTQDTGCGTIIFRTIGYNKFSISEHSCSASSHKHATKQNSDDSSIEGAEKAEDRLLSSIKRQQFSGITLMLFALKRSCFCLSVFCSISTNLGPV